MASQRVEREHVLNFKVIHSEYYTQILGIQQGASKSMPILRPITI